MKPHRMSIWDVYHSCQKKILSIIKLSNDIISHFFYIFIFSFAKFQLPNYMKLRYLGSQFYDFSLEYIIFSI